MPISNGVEWFYAAGWYYYWFCRSGKPGFKKGCRCRIFSAISLCLGVPFLAFSVRYSATALTALSSSASNAAAHVDL